MTLDDAVALFPPESPYRSVVRQLMSEDPDTRRAGRRELSELAAPYWEAPQPKDPAVALAVLRSAVELSFPPRRRRWERDRTSLLFSIFGSAHPPLLEYVRERYATADAELHCSLLTLAASAGTAAGATLVADLIAAHGWPEEMYERLFTELSRNLDHAEVLLPALLRADGGPRIQLGDLLLNALRSDKIRADAVVTTAFVSSLELRARELLLRLPGIRGRAADELSDEEACVAIELGMWVDLAGYVDASVEVLRDAAALPETRIAAFAVASLLRRGEAIDAALFDRIAADPASRGVFYELVAPLGASGRIPARWRTRDAFAEAEMIGWLLHPSELGRCPDALEKMATFESTQEGKPVVLYVWRFRVGDEPWKASVSGPYPAAPPEGPLHGPQTFSRFEDWDSATAEEHALAVLETLGEWG